MISRSRHLARFGTLAVATLLAAVLVATAVFAWIDTGRVASGLARAQGELLGDAVRHGLMARGPSPGGDLLAQIVEQERGAGMTWLALLDGEGTLLAEAGERLGPVPVDLRAPPFLPAGPRMRMTAQPPPHPDSARAPPIFAIEYEPRLAHELVARARVQVAVGGATAALLLVAAWILVRLSRRADASEAALAEQRHLASLGRMSAVLAHEIRNPLAALKGHAQLLHETVQDDPRLEKRAGRVVDAAERLEDLATSLLDFARTGTLNRSESPVPELIRTVTDRYPDAHLSLDLVAAPPTWSLDVERMEQVLDNLVANAVHASLRVEVAAHADDGRLVITVRDRGAGIPADALEQVFEPFHTTRARGTGLGLAVARRIVEQHGGTLTAANHPQGGAVLSVVLPPEPS